VQQYGSMLTEAAPHHHQAAPHHHHASCRAPCLSGKQHDVDPVVMHRLSCAELYSAMQRRYGPNPALVGACCSWYCMYLNSRFVPRPWSSSAWGHGSHPSC
jgi:hypothetical protein